MPTWAYAWWPRRRRVTRVGLTQYYVAQSLDGFIAESDGGLDWLLTYDGDAGPDVSQATEGTYDEFFAQVGAVSMGSATYEFILAEQTGGWPYEGKPCWVFTSRDLPVAEGGDVRFVDGPVGAVHEEMKRSAGEGNLWVVGGGEVASQFADEGLLDQLLVTVVPVLLGAGLPTFARRLEGKQLRLARTRAFANGMTELVYDFVR